MRLRFCHRVLLLVLLLLSAFRSRLQAAEGYAGLTPMITVSFDSLERLMQRVGLGAQGMGFPDGAGLFRRAFANLLLAPNLDGIDSYRPGHYYLLTPDPPDRAPLPAVLLPLADRQGERLLAAVKAQYGTATRKGGIYTFADPGAAEAPEVVFLAIAEEHALLSTGIDGLRWLALHRRDRSLPVAGDIGTPLRVTADGGLFGLFLQLVASLSNDGPASGQDGLGGLNGHLHEIGAGCMAFASLDLGFDAGIREFAVTLRLNAAPRTALASRIDGLQRPSAAFERLLPMPVLDGEISVLPALLPDLPASTAPWLERLAESSQLLGLRLAPRAPGWVRLLLPVLNGQYASGVFASPLGQGLCSLQIFGFDEALKAQAALSILESLLPAPPQASSRVRPLPPRRLGDLRIVGYQVAESATTNDTAVGNLGDVLTQLLGMGTVEMAAPDRCLFIVRGAPGTLDELLKRPAGAGTPSCLDRAMRRFPALKPGQTLLGAGQIAPVATLRAVAEAVPNLQGTRARLPYPGGDLHWRAVKAGASLVWELTLPSDELAAWRQVRTLDADVLQELLTQFALEQFGRAAADLGQQEVLRERLRRLREPRPGAGNSPEK